MLTLNLNRDNYQLGSTKIFMREFEKQKLDYRLHQQIMASIVVLQRWFRVLIERRRFLRLRDAVTTLQVGLLRKKGKNSFSLFITFIWKSYL